MTDACTHDDIMSTYQDIRSTNRCVCVCVCVHRLNVDTLSVGRNITDKGTAGGANSQDIFRQYQELWRQAIQVCVCVCISYGLAPFRGMLLHTTCPCCACSLPDWPILTCVCVCVSVSFCVWVCVSPVCVCAVL